MAEEHGATIESVCSWVANKSFIERRYTTTLVDGTKMSGVQLIGWNPNGGHVQSWDFSPDGGHAVGIWFPQQGGWSAQMRGVTGDGTLHGLGQSAEAIGRQRLRLAVGAANGGR